MKHSDMIVEFISQLEEYDMHDVHCATGREEECDCNMHGLKTIFQTAFTTIQERMEKETAEDICVMIDKYESQAPSNLEQWKEYKKIRNGIRDKYVLNSQSLNKMKGNV